MPIRVLDAQMVGRIAAGEVVERPASVAKELIENALDAGATSITVEIKEGGVAYLRVTDNGSGIPAEEARLAFENHATSKLQSGGDLSDIRTLGFRGEALPSIAAVSMVELTTRPPGQESGVRLNLKGGRVESVKEVGCPSGTSLVMRELFFNTPARRAFLKRPAAEAGAVSDMVMRMILGNPGVSVRFINNGKTVYHSYGDGNDRHTALSVYGRSVAEQLVALDASEGGLRMNGLIGVGDCARPNRSQQSFFVNGRVVRCALLTQALEQVCKGRVTIGQYPMCILHVTLPPHSVDVNVHPNKLEVRFRDEAGIQLSVQALLSRAFAGERVLDLQAASVTPPPVVLANRTSVLVPPAPEEIPADPPPERRSVPVAAPVTPLAEQPEQLTYVTVRSPAASGRMALREAGGPAIWTGMPRRQSEPAAAPEVRLPETRPPELERPAVPSNSEQAVPAADPPAVDVPQPEPLPPYRVVGVAFHTYILIETGDALLMIDQHAAHERLLYERYVRQLSEGNASQQLLMPLVVPMSARERAILLENQQLLMDAGYEVEAFGERDVQVRAVPHVLGRAELRPLFAELIDRLDLLKSATLERRRAEVIQTSCKRAVKGGDPLSELEIEALIREMLETGAPPSCPHGRPVMKVMNRAELERQFKRLQ